LKQMRKSRFFQKDAYIAVDFFEKTCEIVKMKSPVPEPDPFALSIDLGQGRGFREIVFDRPEVPDSNAIRDELASFAKSIRENTTPLVTVDDGFRALEVAHAILEKIEITSGRITL
jgi:predicted dehydrogenase